MDKSTANYDACTFLLKYYQFWRWFSPLPNNNILNQSKLKELAEDKINGTRKLKSVFGWVENIVGKGENAGYQHFLPFPQYFQKAFVPWGY